MPPRIPKTGPQLRQMFVTSSRARLRDTHTRSRIQYFADHANSFEGWLNWELAHAFQARYPWPGFSAHREYKLMNGGFADIALYEGRAAIAESPIAFIETKFVWNNDNATKQIASAWRDRERIALHGHGALVVVAISALQPDHPDLKTQSADVLLARIELEAELVGTARHNLLVMDAVPGPEWYAAPSVRIVAYSTDPT